MPTDLAEGDGPRLAVPLELPDDILAGWRAGVPVQPFAGTTMGTSWRVKAALPDTLVPGALAARLVRRLEQLVARLSHWEADSALSRFNRARAGSWHGLDDDFAQVIACALDIAARSEGAFDPAIGVLVNLYGHGPRPAPHQPPGAEALADARAVSGWQRLDWDAQGQRLCQPGGCYLDLSGIAKGYGVDALAGELEAAGLRHFLVEIGGEFAARGMRPEGDPWWVELETPPQALAQGIAPLRLALCDSAVATSGDYVRGAHTLDPRSGTPVHHVLALSVIHESAMQADAWATALGVMPTPALRAHAEREGLAVRCITREGSRLTEWISPALARMMD